jgi:adsorption protein B
LLALLWTNLASFVWRSALRLVFTAREYGVREGLLALLRLPHANVIAILAGRRALFAYVRTLLGAEAKWDKTFHPAHPQSPIASRRLA